MGDSDDSTGKPGDESTVDLPECPEFQEEITDVPDVGNAAPRGRQGAGEHGSCIGMDQIGTKLTAEFHVGRNRGGSLEKPGGQFT